jgi:hypothetical protein
VVLLMIMNLFYTKAPRGERPCRPADNSLN